MRHKKRQEEAHRNGTGGGPEKPSELKDIELRALGLWGNIVLTGVSKSNAEVGFGPPPPSNTEEVFIANSWGFIAADDDEIVEEDSVITDGNVHSAQPSDIVRSCSRAANTKLHFRRRANNAKKKKGNISN